MKILLYIPLINAAIIMVCFVISAFFDKSDKKTTYTEGIHVDTHLPDGEEYKDKVGSPKDADYRPDIADQFDSRLTNVFKNPWKGIL